MTEVTYLAIPTLCNGVWKYFRDVNKGKAMKTNMGSTDRILRVLAGLILLGLAFTGTFGVWDWVGYVIGAMMLGTAAIGWCPPYALFGWNTCAMKSKP
ncbi:MAG: DUF2892 domain-containing protein [Polaromonas sp.]